MPSWKGIDGTASFAVYNNQITLPRELQAMKKAGYVGPQGEFQVPIRNQWYQFHLNGPGFWNPDNPRISFIQFEDLGDGYCTFQLSSSEFKLKVTTDVAETGNITFYGFDTNGNPIYTGATLGTTLDLSLAPVTGSQVFSGGGLASVIKPITNGNVYLYSVDNVTAVETLIATYQPGETVPSYRRYQVVGQPNEDRQFKALCKRAYVPVIADNDTIIPDNLGALKLGLMALSCEAKQDMQQAQYFWGQSVNTLNAALAEWQGDVSFPIVVQNRAFAGAGIRNLI